MTISHARMRRAVKAAAATVGAVAVFATGLVSTGTAAIADESRSETVYNSIPDSQPGAYPSLGYTATNTREFGDQIHLAGENRKAQTVTVSLTDWACQRGGGTTCDTTPGATFPQEITVTFYAVGDGTGVGAELGHVTKTVAVPYRPSADAVNCTGGNAGKWFDGTSCYNGFAFDAEFDFSSTGLVLPSDVIVGVSYPTHTYGPGSADPASDSLNVSLVSTDALIGADVDRDSMFINSYYAGYAGDGGVGVFSHQSDWSPYGLALTITAAPNNDAAYPSAYLEGFEGDADGLGLVTQVPSGSDGLLSAAGCYYAEAPMTNAELQGDNGFVSTHYAGYTTAFPADGYSASADFYLDADAAEGQFSWSDAVNGTDGSHQRDFIFHAGSDGDGTWSVGVSNNAANSAPYVTSYSVEPLSITESGWYTFKHSFFAEDGLLYADLSVLDAYGNTLATWTLGGDAADKVPSTVGGDRYGWLVNNSYANLPIDNVLLDSERPTNACGTDPGTIAVEVAYDDDPATGGCVDLVDDSAQTVDTVCDVANGEAVFEDVAPGDYTLYFSGFDGVVAAQWYESGTTWSEADVVTVEPRQTAFVGMELQRGGTISGSIHQSGTRVYDGDALLITLDGELAQWTPIRPDGTYKFVDVPKGRYHVYIDDNSLSGNFWVVGVENGVPTTATVPTASGDWNARTGEAQVNHGPLSMLYGVNRTPKGSGANAQCVSAIKGSTLVSQYCGPVNELFFLDRIPKNSSLKVSFQTAVQVPTTNGYAGTGKTIYWPSGTSSKSAGTFKVGGLGSYWLPVYWFKDVSTSTAGYQDIMWMGDTGLNTGNKDGTFRPKATVARSSLAIYLWKLSGSPSVNLTGAPTFKDIKKTSAAYKPAVWMVKNGFAKVNKDGTFGANVSVTRAQLAQTLYKAAGSPSVVLPAKSPFKDVKKTDPNYKALVWYVASHIGVKYADGTFRPNNVVSRAYVASILHRATSI